MLEPQEPLAFRVLHAPEARLAATVAVDQQAWEAKELLKKAAQVLAVMALQARQHCAERENHLEKEWQGGRGRLMVDAKAEIEALAAPVHRELATLAPPELRRVAQELLCRDSLNEPQSGRRAALAVQELAASQESKAWLEERPGGCHGQADAPEPGGPQALLRPLPELPPAEFL